MKFQIGGVLGFADPRHGSGCTFIPRATFEGPNAPHPQIWRHVLADFWVWFFKATILKSRSGFKLVSEFAFKEEAFRSYQQSCKHIVLIQDTYFFGPGHEDLRRRSRLLFGFATGGKGCLLKPHKKRGVRKMMAL